MMTTEDWNDIGRLVNAVFMPIYHVFDEEYRAEIAQGIRANSHQTNGSPDVRRLLWCIADTLDPIPLHEDTHETAGLFRQAEAEEHRARFRLIAGGLRPSRATDELALRQEAPFLDAS